jgi:hypothetical protein
MAAPDYYCLNVLPMIEGARRLHTELSKSAQITMNAQGE